MNKLIISKIVVLLLIITGNTTVWAHSDEYHKKDPRLISVEVKEELKEKSLSEVWDYVDQTTKDLMLEMKKQISSRKSKEELIRLKESLVILKETQIKNQELNQQSKKTSKDELQQ